MATRTFRSTLLAALAVGLAPVLSGAAFAADPGFSFRRAAFSDTGQALDEARAFLAARAPAGLSMDQAVARMTGADLDCRARAAADGARTCAFSVLAGGEGGTLGVDLWTVRLTPDGQGRLAQAQVDHERTGFEP